VRTFTTRYQCFCAGFGFTADYGFIAVTCNLVVTFGDAHWAELIRPQRWAGVRACPPQRQGKEGLPNMCGGITDFPGVWCEMRMLGWNRQITDSWFLILLGSSNNPLPIAHVPLSPSSTIRYQSRESDLCGKEGNHRSSIGLAMCQAIHPPIWAHWHMTGMNAHQCSGRGTTPFTLCKGTEVTPTRPIFTAWCQWCDASRPSPWGCLEVDFYCLALDLGLGLWFLGLGLGLGG